MPSVEVAEFIEIIKEQIRWKKARVPFTKEISDHLEDRIVVLKAEGLDEKAAIELAICEMGDPVVIGQELDMVHRPKPEWSLLLLTLALVVMGFILRNGLDLPPMILPMIIGGVAFAIAYFLDFTFFAKHWLIFLVLLVACSFFSMFYGTIKGSFVHVRPFILLFPVVFAAVLYALRSKGWLGFLLSGLVFVALLMLSLLSSSFSSVLLFTVSSLVLVLMSVYKGWFAIDKKKAIIAVWLIIAAVAMVLLLLLLNDSYRFDRLLAFLSPESDPMGSGYMTLLVRDYVVNAVLLGSGDVGSLAVLPEINYNYILTYVLAHYGWLAFMGIMTVIGVFIARAFVLCKRQKSVLGFLISMAVILTLILQMVFYVLANLGVGLFSPLTLPLISYSGWSLVGNLFLIGLLLSVFKCGELVTDCHKFAINNKKRISWQDGKLIIDFK